MKVYTFEVWKEYSLDATMYPSYVLSMFNGGSGKYVKIGGYGKGLKFIQLDRCIRVEAPEDVDEDYIRELLGIVETPWDYISRTPRSGRPIVEALVNMYTSIGMSTGSRDYHLIFASIILSRRTYYHTNVLRWTRKLFSLINKPEDILELNLSSISTSYQLKSLKIIYTEFINKVDSLIRSSNLMLEDIRRAILMIKGVGPKTADAFLLHGLRALEYAPVDIHFKRFALRLGLGTREPNKNMCLNYSCNKCPLRSNCILRNSSRVLGASLGYVQTLAYVHDKNYCMKGRCSSCLLKNLCTRAN